MRSPVVIFIVAAICQLIPSIGTAQDVAGLMQEAKQLEAAFRDNEALAKYLSVYKLQPDNIGALCQISELYSRLGKRQPSKEKQKQYYLAGRQFALKALGVNENNSDANFVMALAMGRMAQMASGEEKIKAVKDIRRYAEKAIRLDPGSFKGYHVLAKWHYEVSDLNSVERWLVKVIYGGIPDASLQEAIRNYEKSQSLNPAFLLNYLELAKAYNRNGEKAKAIQQLKQLLTMPNSTSEDPTVKEQARKLLNDWD